MDCRNDCSPYPELLHVVGLGELHMWLKGSKFSLLEQLLKRDLYPPSPVVEGAINQTMPICPKLIKIFQWLQPLNSHIYFFLFFWQEIWNPSLSSTYTDTVVISASKTTPTQIKRVHNNVKLIYLLNFGSLQKHQVLCRHH